MDDEIKNLVDVTHSRCPLIDIFETVPISYYAVYDKGVGQIVNQVTKNISDLAIYPRACCGLAMCPN